MSGELGLTGPASFFGGRRFAWLLDPKLITAVLYDIEQAARLANEMVALKDSTIRARHDDSDEFGDDTETGRG